MSEIERARKKAEHVAREKRRARQKRYRDKRKATREATLRKGDRRTNIVKRTRAKALACAFPATHETTLFDPSRKKRFAAGVTCYSGLVEAVRRRVSALGITLNELDELCGYHPGYMSHLLSLDRKHSRNMGAESLPRILAALGLTIALVESPKRTEAAARELAEVRGSRSRRKAREAA